MSYLILLICLANGRFVIASHWESLLHFLKLDPFPNKVIQGMLAHSVCLANLLRENSGERALI